MNPPERDELLQLCERFIEGTLTDEEKWRLESLLLSDAEARRFHVEYVHQHAALQWGASETPVILPASGWRKPPEIQQTRGAYAPRWVGLRWYALAASLLLAVGAWWLLKPSSFATLQDGKSCKWDGGTLPTEIGARLKQGRLRLADGLARIVFDSGAEITLEAPADLELTSSSRCVLHAGRLTAKVPPSAIGFTVDTPSAILEDLGTEFGVSVRDDRTSDVQVFDGLVDVKHRASGNVERMKTGRNRRFSSETVSDFDPNDEKPRSGVVLPKPVEGARALTLSTATGRGKDAYVQRQFPSQHMSDTLLLVKNTVPGKADYNRKAYLGFDLSSIKSQKLLDARLTLTFAPTDMGFAAEVPDSTFTLYGLTDEALDDWDERAMRWRDAPANRDDGTSLDPEKVVKIGTFEIAQGVQSGTRSIDGKALVEFLKRDTNGLATFILVRETSGTGRNDMVHGFASKDHPTLTPPTLRLTVSPQ